MIGDSTPELAAALEISATAHGLERQAVLLRQRITEIAADPGNFATFKSLFDLTFTHMRKDPGIISAYLPILQFACERQPKASRLLEMSTTKHGHCPQAARPAILSFLNSQEQSRFTKSDLKVIASPASKVSQSSTASLASGGAFDELFPRPVQAILGSQVSIEFAAALAQVRSDVEKLSDAAPPEREVPNTIGQFAASVRAHYGLSLAEQSIYFLSLAQVLARSRTPVLFQMSLCQYAFLKARTANGNTRQVRHYFQAGLFAYGRVPTDAQHVLSNHLYQTLHIYFATYNLYLVCKEPMTEMADRFYGGLRNSLIHMRENTERSSLGLCLSSLAYLYPAFVFDLVNRIRTRGDERALFPILVAALSEHVVFRAAPYECLQLLFRLAPSSISDALCKQSFSKADTRRAIASALLAFANDSSDFVSTGLLKPFGIKANADLKKDLAFSLLMEPQQPSHQQPGSERRAALVTDALGIASDAEAAEYFRARMTEIGDLFARQSQTTDPNHRGSYGFNILENIRLSRKWLVFHLRGDLKEEILQFLRSVEGFVTTEQAKLIRDTELELSLANSRAVYDPINTRITLELRNVGHGSADGLELETIPVDGQYDVEERHRFLKIESLSDRLPIQRDIWIRPLVAANSSIDLVTRLRYNTLKERGKTATLSATKRTISLYPEAQYVRVTQPYSIGEPATTWFYGRESLLDAMASSLHFPGGSDQSMIVYGLKRAGKTSVLKRFISHTLSSQSLEGAYCPVYVDLLSNPATATLNETGFLRFVVQLICHGVRSLLPSNHLAANVSLLDNDFARNPTEAFGVVMEEVLGSLAPRRVLLALDEFSTLNEWLCSPRLSTSEADLAFGFLSNYLQSTKELTFIFTGTYMLLEMMRVRAFDLAKTCIPFMVGFLDEQSARKLVEEPAMKNPENPDSGWLEYDPRTVDRIVYLTNRHPYLIQYLCMQIVNRMNALKHNTVNLNDVESVRTEIVSRPMHAPALLALWNEFSEKQHAVLAIIAAMGDDADGSVEIGQIAQRGSGVIAGLSERDVATVCTTLADAEMLERDSGNETGSYRITVPLFHAWLRENRMIESIAGATVRS